MSMQRDNKVMSKTSSQNLVEDREHRSIVLVGLMGAGKSSVGRRLAAELGLPLKMPTLKSKKPLISL